jgi:hypothetical protein
MKLFSQRKNNPEVSTILKQKENRSSSRLLSIKPEPQGNTLLQNEAKSTKIHKINEIKSCFIYIIIALLFQLF